MELAQRTQPAVDQLALWYLVSGRSGASAELMLSAQTADRKNLGSMLVDYIDIFLSNAKSYRLNSYNHSSFILGYCSLFSSCKAIRARSDVLFDVIETVFRQESDCGDFNDLSLMTGLSHGDRFILVRNFFFQFVRVGRPHVVFYRNVPLPTLPAVTNSAPAMCTVVNGVHIQHGSWTWPLNPIERDFANLFMRFQLNGSLYEILKFGFFSSSFNRGATSVLLMQIHSRKLSDYLVVNKDRLDALQKHLDHSIGIVDLSPEIIGVPEVQSFTHLPGLTGLHVGVTPGQIQAMNFCFARENRPVGLSFRAEQ